MKEWSEQRSAMTKMPEKIIQTVDKSCIVFINDYSSPYMMLRDLRARMKPDNKVYQDLLLKKWKKLQTYPNRQSPENWVNEYEAHYLKLKEVGYFSGSAINVVRDFIDILPESTFSTYLSGAIQAGFDMDINTVLQKFRNHAASNLAKPGTQSKSAFSNPKLQGNSTDNDDDLTLKKKDDDSKKKSRSQRPRCEACGGIHPTEGCFFLFPEKRPQDWTPFPEKEKKVLEKIKSDPTFAQKIKKLRKEDASKDAPSAHVVMKPLRSTDSDRAAYTTSDYELRDSLLLDSGASDHVSNDRKRFK
jgi:hypothetical protein